MREESKVGLGVRWPLSNLRGDRIKRATVTLIDLNTLCGRQELYEIVTAFSVCDCDDFTKDLVKLQRGNGKRLSLLYSYLMTIFGGLCYT